jgi:UDP-N-acetylglucosamine:LPS N-acetylglucosamine transferase
LIDALGKAQGGIVMAVNDMKYEELQDRLDTIIARMQRIQRDIRSSGQPASMREIAELQQLGRDYGLIIDQLSDGPVGNDVA